MALSAEEGFDLKLTRARVTDYRSIDDSGWVDIDDVTCLMGKNESGKTAFLAALKKLNPVEGAGGNFDLKDYPRKGYVKYRRRHATDPAVVVRAQFRLDDEEVREIETEYGTGVMPSSLVTVSKDYNNTRMWDFEVDETSLVRHLVVKAGLPEEIRERTLSIDTVEELRSMLKRLDIKPPVVADLLVDLDSRFDTGLKDQVVEKHPRAAAARVRLLRRLQRHEGPHFDTGHLPAQRGPGQARRR